MTDEVREGPLDEVTDEVVTPGDEGTEGYGTRGSWLNRILVLVAVLLVVAVGGLGFYVYRLATVPQAPQTFADVQIQELQTRIRQSPKNSALYLQLAANYYNIKEYDKALKALDDLRSTGVTGTPLAESVYATGKIEQTRGNEQAAVNGFEKSLKIAETADARWALGSVALKAKDWGKAIENLARYCVLNPNDVAGYKALGQAYEGKGDKANALKQYQKALSYVPTDADAQAAVKRLKGQ